MIKKIKKIIKYAKGLLSIISTIRPRTFFRKLAGSQYVVKRLKNQKFSIMVNVGDNAIGRPILYTGQYEPNVASIICRYLTPKTRFLDIGANIGYFSLLAASRCPEGAVISFEPDQDNYNLLRANIVLNNLESIITAYPFAVSDRDEGLIISDLGSGANTGSRFTGRDEASLRPHVHGPGPKFSQVKAVRLDSFLPNEHFDLIKIDIEGFEPHALKGMENIIKTQKPVLIIEFAPSNLVHIGKTDPGWFLSYLTGLGYSLGIIEDNATFCCFNKDCEGIMAQMGKMRTHHADLLLLPV